MLLWGEMKKSDLIAQPEWGGSDTVMEGSLVILEVTNGEICWEYNGPEGTHRADSL